jgi:putative oxidoreductase
MFTLLRKINCSRLHSLAPLTVRLGLAIIFLAHGSMKLFGVFGGHGFGGVVGMVQTMGFWPPVFWALLLVFAEFGGAIMALLGLFGRLAGLMIAIDMIVAIAKVHGPKGFFITHQATGFEYNLALIALAVSLVFSGSGVYSLDHLLWSRYAKQGSHQQ